MNSTPNVITIIPSITMADINVMEFSVEGSLRKFRVETGCVLSSTFGRLNAKYNAGSERTESRMKIVRGSKRFNKKGAISKASIGPKSCKLLLIPNAIP